MNKNKNFNPDWENSYKWKEFEWEEALKFSDDLASRYFQLLDRFGDLPDAEDLIAAKLGEHNFSQFELAEYDDDNFGDLDDFDEFDKENDLSPGGLEIEPGDSLYFETCPVYQRARQIALGWCNITASVLDEEDRFWGLVNLFYLGRLLSYLSLAIGDGTFEQLNASVIFTKRALKQINYVLGEVREKEKDKPKYRPIFKFVNRHLLENHDLVVDYLMDCKKRHKNT